MAKTGNLAVVTTGPVQINVLSSCETVSVFENAMGVTTSYQFRSSPNDPWVILPKGQPLNFQKRTVSYRLGQYLGDIQAIDANATFAQLEL